MWFTGISSLNSDISSFVDGPSIAKTMFQVKCHAVACQNFSNIMKNWCRLIWSTGKFKHIYKLEITTDIRKWNFRINLTNKIELYQLAESFYISTSSWKLNVNIIWEIHVVKKMNHEREKSLIGFVNITFDVWCRKVRESERVYLW